MLSPILLIVGTVMLTTFLAAVGAVGGLIYAGFEYGKVVVTEWYRNRAKA